MDVGALLVQARTRAQLTRTQLAHAAGTSPSAVSAYERGVRSPTVSTLDRLLAGCGLQVRAELEPYLADLDAAVDRLLLGPSELPSDVRRVAAALDEAGLRWAYDGRTALVLHGLGADVTFPEVVAVGDDVLRRCLYDLCVPIVDRDGEPLWNSWLSVDLAEVGTCMAFTRSGAFVIQVVAELSPPVRLLHDGVNVPVRTLLQLEKAHPALADLLARLRERS